MSGPAGLEQDSRLMPTTAPTNTAAPVGSPGAPDTDGRPSSFADHATSSKLPAAVPADEQQHQHHAEAAGLLSAAGGGTIANPIDATAAAPSLLAGNVPAVAAVASSGPSAASNGIGVAVLQEQPRFQQRSRRARPAAVGDVQDVGLNSPPVAAGGDAAGQDTALTAGASAGRVAAPISHDCGHLPHRSKQQDEAQEDLAAALQRQQQQR